MTFYFFERSRSAARKKSELGKEPEGVAAAGGVEKQSLYLLGNSECSCFNLHNPQSILVGKA